MDSQKSKDIEYIVVKNNITFQTAEHVSSFFSTEGKQKLLPVSGRFEFFEGSSYQGLNYRKRMKEIRGNRFWFELARGSSYREWTVITTTVLSLLPTGARILFPEKQGLCTINFDVTIYLQNLCFASF